MAIVQKQPPGDITLLLSNNFQGADPESALALRFLRSAIPKCWDFEPRRRPSMSILLSQMSDISSVTVDVARENECGRIGGSNGGATFAEAREIPSGGADQNEVERESDQDVSENYHPQREEATVENVRVDHRKTGAKGSTDTDVNTQGDPRNALMNAHPQDNQLVEENVTLGQDGTGLKEGPSNDEQETADQVVAGDKVADIVADHPSAKISIPALDPIILVVVCIIALLSAVAFQSLQISDSSPIPGSVAIHPDHASDEISPQPLSTIIWPAAFILSVFANICLAYFALRKADYPPSRDPAKPTTSALEQASVSLY